MRRRPAIKRRASSLDDSKLVRRHGKNFVVPIAGGGGDDRHAPTQFVRAAYADIGGSRARARRVDSAYRYRLATLARRHERVANLPNAARSRARVRWRSLGRASTSSALGGGGRLPRDDLHD